MGASEERVFSRLDPGNVGMLARCSEEEELRAKRGMWLV